MNPYTRAKERIRKNIGTHTGVMPYTRSCVDSFGRIVTSKRPIVVQYAEKVRKLSDAEFEHMRVQGKLPTFLGARHNKTYIKNTENLRMLAIAGGKREFLGTTVGDVIKLINEGKKKEVMAMGRTSAKVLDVLEAARILDPQTGRVDKHAIEESLKKGRLVRGKL